MKKTLVFTSIIFAILFGIFFLTHRDSLQPFEKTFLYFDTFVKIKFYPEKGLNTETIMKRVERELQRIDNLYGYGNESLSHKLREHKKAKITKEEYFILKKSIYVSDITDGSFDITVGSLEDIWGFREEKPHLPEREEIIKELSRIGYTNILLTDTSIALKEAGIIIDLGGISKGYAVDRIVKILKEEGVKAGIVDAGGDLRTFGKKPDGKKWLIGIRDPRRPGSIIKKFYINKGAVATSGNYERFFIKYGKRYNHILDPHTGYPADGCVSVTVLTDEAIMSDALATGIFVLGPKKGMALIERLKNVEGLIMYEENDSLEIIKSTGIELEK